MSGLSTARTSVLFRVTTPFGAMRFGTSGGDPPFHQVIEQCCCLHKPFPSKSCRTLDKRHLYAITITGSLSTPRNRHFPSGIRIPLSIQASTMSAATQSL